MYNPGAEFPNLVWPGSVPSIGKDKVVVDGSGLLVSPLSHHNYMDLIGFTMFGFFFYLAVVIQFNGSLIIGVTIVVINPARALHELALN